MKLRSLLLSLLVLLVVAAACQDPGESRRSDPGDERAAALAPRAGDPGARREDTAAGVPRERYRSRIGIQPWPGDLPAHWPTPEAARVLADTRRGRDGRLLLVDLPGPPDHALSSYRDALHRSGFSTQRPRDPRLRHALHAHRGDDQAVLTFFARDDATRLEIFFVTASG